MSGLSGSIPSFLLPDGHALTYHQHRAILPPALGHSAIQTAPAHKKEQATGVRWLGWTGMLACLRSPAYPIHVATDTCSLDQSFLISVNGFQLDIASGSSGGTCLAPPARHKAASAGRGVVGQKRKRGGRHSRQEAVSAHGRIRVHSPPPFPLRPRPAGPTLFPPISCPAVLWLLGQAGNKVLQIRGTGGLAALPTVGTTTAASEIGAG